MTTESAQDYEETDSRRPDIEAIEIRSGVVNIYNVKIRDAGIVAVNAEQLTDFRRFNQACIAQLWRALDPPPSALAWSQHIETTLRTATRLGRPGETRHRHGFSSWDNEEVEWTVHERIPRNGVGLLSGPSGSFKTFMLLEISGRLMAGLYFLEEQVQRRCGSLIFAAEGANTIRPRMRALIEHRLAKASLLEHRLAGHHGLNLDALPFAFVDSCRPLWDPRTVDWVVAQARMTQEHFRTAHGVDLGFIGIDPITAAAGWDNDATQTQIVMNHLADVSAATDTFVLAVDPFDPDAIKESVVDTIFHIRGKSDDIGGFTDAELVLHKQRYGPSGITFPFDAPEVPMGNDTRLSAP
jgi:hypothetical protein